MVIEAPEASPSRLDRGVQPDKRLIEHLGDLELAPASQRMPRRRQHNPLLAPELLSPHRGVCRRGVAYRDIDGREPRRRWRVWKGELAEAKLYLRVRMREILQR